MISNDFYLVSNVEAFSEQTLTWNTFHKLFTCLEVCTFFLKNNIIRAYTKFIFSRHLTMDPF